MMIRKFAAALVMLMVFAAVARAAPSDSTPESGQGVNGAVRALVAASGNMWAGGRFTQVVENTSAGAPVNAATEVNLAAFDLNGSQLNIGPDLGGTGSIVYDLALGRDGRTVYAAGKFSASGATNLISFDGLTGGSVVTYNTPVLFSVHDDGTTLWAGSRTTLFKVAIGGNETAVADIATVGGTATRPRVAQISDIETAPQGGVFLACKCDRASKRGGSQVDTKAFIHVEQDGSIDTSWSPVNLTSNAVGWEVLVSNGVAYLSAGGSDFVQAVGAADGLNIWKTDTNGQVQTSELDGDMLVIGGHYRLVRDGGADYCQPRLTGLDASNGRVIKSFHPAPNPKYPGVWALEFDGNSTWAGGEFSHVGADWQRTATDGCVYRNGDEAKPLHSGANPWFRGVARFE